MENLISVVVPVYNSEKYLEQCLDSIVNQTHKNIELICVDDGSTDSSLEIINKYMEKDKRVSLLYQEHKGAGAARNLGLRKATGKYIFFLDSDDFFDLTMFEKMYKRAEAVDADIVMCGCRVFDARYEQYCDLEYGVHIQWIPDKKVFSSKDIPEYIFQIGAGWAWDKLFKLDFVMDKKLFFQEIAALNDGLFVDLALIEAERLSVVKNYLVSYRINHATSITANRFKNWRCIFQMISEKEKQLYIRGVWEKYKQSYVNNALSLLMGWAQRFDKADDAKEFFEELQIWNQRMRLSEYQASYFYFEGSVDFVEDVTEGDALKFWMNLKSQIVENCMSCIHQMQFRKSWIFSLSEIEKGARIIIYGYGDVGKDLCKYVWEKTDLFIVAVVDRKYEFIRNNDFDAICIDEIFKYEYDYIVVAMANNRAIRNIKNELLKRGISETKIVCFNF